MSEQQLPFGGGAVMAQRHEDPDSLDFFPTPPWATRALFQHVLPHLSVRIRCMGTVLEPACGQGHMARVIEEYCPSVIATDIHAYGYGSPPIDFLAKPRPMHCLGINWIITNPPFNLGLEFALTALDRNAAGVALLVRTQWLEGRGRYEKLFTVHPPRLVAPFVERVPMVKGRWDPDASTMTSYAWVVWTPGYTQPDIATELFWIPPCRAALTKPDDRLRFGPAPDSVPLDVDTHLVEAVSALEGFNQ